MGLPLPSNVVFFDIRIQCEKKLWFPTLCRPRPIPFFKGTLNNNNNNICIALCTGVSKRFNIVSNQWYYKTIGYYYCLFIYSAISNRTITIHVIANKIVVIGGKIEKNMLNRTT